MPSVLSPKGVFRDLLRSGSGEVLFDSGWCQNTIMDGCRLLLARLLRFDFNTTPTPEDGVFQLHVGQGDPSWDGPDGPPPVDSAGPGLVNPYTPPMSKAQLMFEYLDGHGNPAADVTHRLQIEATLGERYPEPIPPLDTYPLREFGLFGRFDGSLYQINAVRHRAIHKRASDSLIRTIRLVL